MYLVPGHDINTGSPFEGSKEHNYSPIHLVHKKKTDKWQKLLDGGIRRKGRGEDRKIKTELGLTEDKDKMTDNMTVHTSVSVFFVAISYYMCNHLLCI